MFGEDISGFKIGRHKDVRITRNLRTNVFGFCGVFADRVVERQGPIQDRARNLSSLRHFAKGSGIDGRRHLRGHGFDRRKDCNLWPLSPERDRQIDGILTNIDLVFQRRSDINCAVSHDQHFVIRRYIHDEYMADPACGS